jgi:hypothetical protein
MHDFSSSLRASLVCVPRPLSRKWKYRCLVAFFLAAIGAGPTLAFTPTLSNGDPLNILTDPNNFISWDKGDVDNPITYSFSSEFLAAYPSAKQREQAHKAFGEWGSASVSFFRRADDALYEWRRLNSSAPKFWDLRSVLTHEVGHALGSGHPDASWFNDTDPGPNYVPWHRNYQPDGQGGYEAAAPLGGEVLNEGNTEGYLPGLKPPKGLDKGEYWRKVSKDELHLLDYLYDRHLHFDYIGADNADADIEVDLYADPDDCDGSLGNTMTSPGASRGPGQGWSIDHSRIIIHTSCSDAAMNPPIGFVAKPAFWEITNNTGEDVISLLVQTFGTDNTVPTDVHSDGARRFTNYTNFYTEIVDESLETILHQWTNPTGGPILNGGQVSVALQQDVWDWQVEKSQFLKADMTTAYAALVDVDPFFLPVFQSGSLLATTDDQDGELSNDLTTFAGPLDFAFKSLRIVNRNDEPVAVGQLLVASIAGRALGAGDLGPDLLARLQTAGIVEDALSGHAPLTLGPGGEFYVITEGTIDDLPRELLAAGNFLLWSRPGLVDEELFTYANAKNSASTVINYSLLNTGVFVPEPATRGIFVFALVAIGATSTGRRRVHRDGGDSRPLDRRPIYIRLMGAVARPESSMGQKSHGPTDSKMPASLNCRRRMGIPRVFTPQQADFPHGRP